MKTIRILSIVLLLMTPTFSGHVQASELPRSTLLGIMPERADNGQHVVLRQVVANSTASTLGLKPEDKILAINGKTVADFNELLSVIRPLKSGQAVSVKIERNGEVLTMSSVMQPRPYEISEHADVLYESVIYDGNQLRSITYKPKSAKENNKAPAIYFIQGYTCGSIDMGMMPQATTKQMMEQFAEAGYVVFRVEKPGVGDSVSEQHCSEIDFTAESNGFTQALIELKRKAYVDSSRVYLWGHSLGVLHSAIVANNEPVAGVIGYGGVLKPWYDYMLDIYRHQSVKHFGTSESQAKRNVNLMQPVLDMWLNSDKKWSEVVNDKTTRAAINAEMVNINGEQIINRHYSFFRDLNKYDFASYWKKLDVPLLMLHGSLDIQAIEKKWAFDLVSLSNNSHSKAVEIEGAEHAFMRYDNAAQYMTARNEGTFNPAQPGRQFDKRIGQISLGWLDSLTQRAQYSGVNHIKYTDGSDDKAFVGNGFLISHKGKTYAVTVKHALLEAKTNSMNSVSIEGHISDWRIYPNHSPNQFIQLGKLLNESTTEPLDMNILSKDWLLFEVNENQSNLRVLKLRNSPLKEGETLTAFGCSYVNKTQCIQDSYKGAYLAESDNNLRVAMPGLDLTKLRGLSGSPVLDENKRLVGIVSNVLPSKSGKGFDFAPANLLYLRELLDSVSS